MNRAFEKWQQLERARHILNNAPQSWGEFLRIWCAFNALYSLGTGASELDKIGSVIQQLTENSRAMTVASLDREISHIPSPVPGDMRYTDDDERFRHHSELWARTAKDKSVQSHSRLGAILSLAYRVRCNLVHGSKTPNWQRDTELVEWAQAVLLKVIPQIDNGLR